MLLFIYRAPKVSPLRCVLLKFLCAYSLKFSIFVVFPFLSGVSPECGGDDMVIISKNILKIT